jgi:cyanuric acid amidohydrolase
MHAQRVEVFRIPMRGPGDASGLLALIEEGKLDPHDIVAVLAKTEGNGCVNDFTREYTAAVLAGALAPHLGRTPLEVERSIPLIMSGGTEGVLSPHATVFSRRFVDEPPPAAGKRLAVGIAFTRAFLPEELGRTAQIEETAQAVRAAMRDAAIEDIADVHFVQIKCPLLTSERIEAAKGRGRGTATEDPYVSMGYSRGASALGVARALGEVPGAIADSDVLRNWSLHSSVASISAGIEVDRNLVILLGNSPRAVSDFAVGHAVMRDAIDLQGVLGAFSSAGVDNPFAGGDPAACVVNVFAKAEAAPNGLVRGYRHTMLDDSDINSTRHARAAVGGLIAGVAGCGAVYVSGGAEHQGPPGGGPVAVIVRQPASR